MMFSFLKNKVVSLKKHQEALEKISILESENASLSKELDSLIISNLEKSAFIEDLLELNAKLSLAQSIKNDNIPIKKENFFFSFLKKRKERD